MSVLRAHRLAAPKNDLDLVFANSRGGIEHRNTIVEHGLHPAQIAAGIVKPKLDKAGRPKLDPKGRPIMGAKYPGLHSLRHFHASWLINRRADGGLELPAKMVQERMGHASIGMTMDVYGHLFPRGDDGGELEAAAAALAV